jgi:hypothetical protein
MDTFVKNNFDSLTKIYIQERLNAQKELGILYLSRDDASSQVNVSYFPLSNPILSDELRNDIIKKNNYDNSIMFIVFENQLMTYNLRK